MPEAKPYNIPKQLVYVRRLMGTLERDIGRKVEWAAVNHYDTSHPQARIVVRGVDRDGREVRIDRGYISAGMRWRAQELATEELGPRPEKDVRRAPWYPATAGPTRRDRRGIISSRATGCAACTHAAPFEPQN